MTDSRTVVAVVVAVGTLPIAAAALGAGSASTISLGDSVAGAQDGTISAAPGETVTVQVWANATEVRGYQANLTFDPSVVEVTAVSGSSDFDDPVATVNNDTGWVAFNQLRAAEMGDPVLAEITVRFSENASSSTQLAFVESATKLSNGDGETVSPESYNGVELAVENSSPTPTPTETPTDTPTPTPTETPTDTPTPTPTETPTDTPTETSDDTSNEVGDDTGSNGGGGSTNNDDSGGGAISPPEPSFSIVATSLNRSSVTPGDPVTVSGTVENTGDDDGTFAGHVYSNGTSMGANTTVEIPEREQRQVNVTVCFDSPGVHAVRLNSMAAGNVTVRLTNETANTTRNETTDGTANGTTNATPEPTATATDSDNSETPASRVRTTTGGSGPGFGAAALAVSLSLLLGWLGYRQAGLD